MARICALMACMAAAADVDSTCIAGTDPNSCDEPHVSLLQTQLDVNEVLRNTEETKQLTPSPNGLAVGRVPLRAWRMISKEERSREFAVVAVNASEKVNLTGGVATMRAASTDEQQAFVTMHNMYRCMHGVPAVDWNNDVAASAEKYIAPLTDMVHSDSYNLSPPAGPAGENLAWSSAQLTAAEAVKMWYEEVNNCQDGTYGFTDGCADGIGGETGHFTALIWKGVKEIGCAFSDNGQLVICRYKAGNSLSNDTPNMNKPTNYPSQVFPQVKTEEECGGGGGGGGGGGCEDSAEYKDPEGYTCHDWKDFKCSGLWYSEDLQANCPDTCGTCGGGGGGGGGGSSGKCLYADPNWTCQGAQCVPKDAYQSYSAAGGKWCLTSDSSYCQGTDKGWCGGKCACPGNCPHACGRCPA